jgi:hypothetical protein
LWASAGKVIGPKRNSAALRSPTRGWRARAALTGWGPPVGASLHGETVRERMAVGLEQRSTAGERRRPRRDSDEVTAAVGGRRAYQADAGLRQYAR